MRDVVLELLAKLRNDKPFTAEGWEAEYCDSVCQMTGHDCPKLRGEDVGLDNCEKLVAARLLIGKEQDRIIRHYAQNILDFSKKESDEFIRKNVKAVRLAVAERYHVEFTSRLPLIESLLNNSIAMKQLVKISDAIYRTILDENK